MTETQKRIKALKASLPGLKERVLAVALLLVMSAAMMTSATYAWLTISLRPELTGVNTSVAANGNLEIALATGEKDNVLAPGESQVGDSSAAEGQTITGANITWGNLVNLGDPQYGLDKLVLRPAQLNTAALLTSPLYGAVYNADGRISQLSSEFGYAKWVMPTDEKPGYFGVSKEYGVRAISSTKVEAVGAEATYYKMVQDARNKNLAAANTYIALGNNDKYMQSLATMMGLFMTARMNPDNATLKNPECAIEDIQNLRDMYGAFLDAFDQEAEAMAALANLHLFLQHGEGNYTPYTADMIYKTTTAKLKAEGIQITNLDQFIKDRNTIATDYEKLKEICSSGVSLTWNETGISEIVNHLVDVGECTIGADNTPIKNIGASNAMSYLSGTQEAKITNGILYRFEERTGGYLQVKDLSISATVERKGITIPASVKANIQTTAPRDYNLFTNDLTYAESQNKGNYAGGIPVAEDTYGLAVDLWVRTNAEGSYLTLEGNVLTESHEVKATGRDTSGNEVQLYTLTRSTKTEEGDTVSYTMDLYWREVETTDENGDTVKTTVWYNAETHATVTLEEGEEPKEKRKTVVTVIGYEGANRVWSDNELLSSDATTQGSGSCYVYYADTPEDQARSLKLLEAFNVAFVDEDGKLLASAIMDTEHYYAVNGRVIVPLILDTGNAINLGEDYEGNVTYAITALEKNIPKWITAIVYLDGTKLTNDQVLSAADIQGQLNIQFGSSSDLSVIENEELASKELRVSASLDIKEFDYDTHTGDMTTKVTIHVDGDTPGNIEAFFIRQINATQGSREETMKDFRSNDTGDWEDSYKFTSPGVYVLRSVYLDGVEHILETPQTVTIRGFTVKSLTSSGGNRVKAMTADNSVSVDLKLQFASSDPSKMPKTVQGRYLRDDGTAVNVDFTYNSTSGTWSGSATFLTSGNYTMQYLLLDGKYTELDEGMWQHADVTLGMRVAVYTTSPHKFKYVPSEMAENEKLLGMQVKILDNAGNEMPGLEGVKLTYGLKGSGIKTMFTDLTWNGSYYVGELTTTGPGIWQFGNVVVETKVEGNTQSSVLTTATTSPTFTVQSPEPPEYVDHRTSDYQYVPNNNATMNVVLKNAPTATVQARIVNGEGKEHWVTSTSATTNEDGTTQFRFDVPKDSYGYQDGHWTLTDLRIWDAFAADGTEYTEDAPLEIDVSDTNNVTKVVAQVHVAFTENKSADFGKDANGNVTGLFMQEYSVSGLQVKIHDFENKKIEGISDVKLSFVYGNNSESYGGYTSTQLTNAIADFTIALTDSGDGITFTQTGEQILRYAGSYATTFSFELSGKTFSYTGNTLQEKAPVFTVSSKAPTVTITEIGPTGTFSVDDTAENQIGDTRKTESRKSGWFTDYRFYWETNSSHKTGYSPIKTNTSATVYFKCSHTNESPYGYTQWRNYQNYNDPNKTVDYHEYEQPWVTIKLVNMGNASGATLAFKDSSNADAHVYARAGETTKTNYAWTANGDQSQKRYIGLWGDSDGDDDTKTAADEITATELIMTFDADGNGTAEEYKFTVALTIDNPC